MVDEARRGDVLRLYTMRELVRSEKADLDIVTL